MKNDIQLNNVLKRSRRSPARQKGLAMVLFTIGMLIVLVVAGLALDVSHAMLNKTRLQNALDMSALAAAKVLDDSGDTALATAAAREMFQANAEASGNASMAEKIPSGTMTVEFSATLEPFVNGSSPPEYVRVGVRDFSLDSWIIQIIGIPEKNIRASAVSGPSTPLGNVCKVVPLIVCGDTDPLAEGIYGYVENDITVLKSGSDTDACSNGIGPGNFQEAELGGSGANVLRDNLAGGAEFCSSVGDIVTTKTGNNAGPTKQGLNTRFAQGGGPLKDDFPPDVIIEQPSKPLTVFSDDNSKWDNSVCGTIQFDGNDVTGPDDIDFNYQDYQARLANNDYDQSPESGAAFGRRILPVVVADCAGKNSGKSDLPVLTVACFFMLQEVGQGGKDNEVYGQFIEDCQAEGNVSTDTPVDGPYKIVLHNDPNSKDS